MEIEKRCPCCGSVLNLVRQDGVVNIYSGYSVKEPLLQELKKDLEEEYDMFCTDKERQTCDVEKRGCEGCYYKGVSEEDILEECNELAKNEHHELGDCWDEEYSAKAIKGLIKLYNQEKEKNKKYKAVAIKINNSITQNGIVIFDVSNLTQKIEDLEDKIKKAIEYIDRWEINSIGTPFTYTAPGKELLKILKGDVTNND